MEFLKQLITGQFTTETDQSILEAKKPKKKLRKASQAVYHRDYEATKNRPYRQYHSDNK